MTVVPWVRSEIAPTAKALSLKVPKNLGDVPYTFRFRNDLPMSVRARTPAGFQWVIVLAGRGKYEFQLRRQAWIEADTRIAPYDVPDATPGIVSLYSLTDEQALLALLRYNRLIDVFLGAAGYSLQNHLRTTVPGMGQVETDELYVAIGPNGQRYAIPVQAKGGNDRLGIVQIEQDVALCAAKYPNLICRPIAAQFMDDNVVALFEMAPDPQGYLVKKVERHYRLVKTT